MGKINFKKFLSKLKKGGKTESEKKRKEEK